MTTIDDFLKTNGIEKVDILKSDTQGYDYEVLKGAEEAMQANRIGLVYFEFIFSDMYEKLPPFDQVFRIFTIKTKSPVFLTCFSSTGTITPVALPEEAAND